MTTVTRQEFENMPVRTGGDLWNKYKLCNLAFNKFKNAQSISYTIGTGLWVHLSYCDAQGNVFSGSVYENDPWGKTSEVSAA